MSGQNSNERAPQGPEPVDPLQPISEQADVAPATAPSPAGPARVRAHTAHTRSPRQTRARRPSFGANILAASPSQTAPTADQQHRKQSLGSSSVSNLAAMGDPAEVDALGMLHNDVSASSLAAEAPGSSFIDHTASTRPPHRKPQAGGPQRHRRQSSLSSSSSGKNRYVPTGVLGDAAAPPVLPTPSQVTRPSFAEQWVTRQNSVDRRSRLQPNPFAPEEPLQGYGSTADQSPTGRNASERRRHMASAHHLKYTPLTDTPFSDDYTDTFPPGLANDRPSSESDEFEFSGSNPSSRRSSDSASLDDVCFPLVDIGSEGTGKQWPDLHVLEEFAAEERKELEAAAKASAREFQQQHQQAAQAAQQQQQLQSYDMASQSSVSSPSPAVNFQSPLVSNIDTNTPVSKLRVSETAPINGRLRPPKVVPWDPKPRAAANPMFMASGTSVPTVPAGHFDYSRTLIEQFRFTYFREDLDATVHSPTISGLLHDGQAFADLFSAAQYGVRSMNSSTALDPAAVSNNIPAMPPAMPSAVPSAVPSAAASGPAASKPPTVTKTPTPSIKGLEEPGAVAPFWLDVLNPTEEEMKVLSKAFGIHPLTTEDIFLGETREKVELFRDYYLVCFRSFDIVHERYKQKKAWERTKEQDDDDDGGNADAHAPRAPHAAHAGHAGHESKLKSLVDALWRRRKSASSNRGTASSASSQSDSSSQKLRARKQKLKENKQKGGYRHKPREGELAPLNMYIIVFREGVITFHFAPTPHPVNVRRRARLLRDYLTVSADWIGYALIDDITDAFAPMIESIEDEVNSIEDAILKMNSYDSDEEHDGDDSDSQSENDSDDDERPFWKRPANDKPYQSLADNKSSYSRRSKRSHRSSRSTSSTSSSSSSSSKSSAQIAGWKRKGDMLRRIGECRKRVMSILRLLGSKADVIKGFAKRCNEQWEVAPRSEIGMYLGDIQDHIVTMVQSLNHYEKLLARSHSNYLAQINIDMTRVNNDMNDVLGKITILGTVVLPMNIITGLWGMNVIVPGQDVDSLVWFFGIFFGMCLLAMAGYAYARKAAGFVS